MTRRQHPFIRTHWVKAQLSILIVSQPDALIRPPSVPPGEKKKHVCGLCGGVLGAWVLAAAVSLLFGFCYIVFAQSGLPWRRCGRRFLAQVANPDLAYGTSAGSYSPGGGSLDARLPVK